MTMTEPATRPPGAASSTRIIARRRSRRKLLSWIPITIVALLCVGFVVAAVAMQNSWWIDADRPASADQEAADGMSIFTGAGIDYIGRQGLMKIRVTEDALPADELGLPADGSERFEPIVPVTAIILGGDGVFSMDLVRSFTVTTTDGRVDSIELSRVSDGAWLTVFPYLNSVAERWGFTAADVAALQDDLTAASREEGADQYSAAIEPVLHNGALSSAEITVDTRSSQVTVTFEVAVADAE